MWYLAESVISAWVIDILLSQSNLWLSQSDIWLSQCYLSQWYLTKMLISDWASVIRVNDIWLRCWYLTESEWDITDPLVETCCPVCSLSPDFLFNPSWFFVFNFFLQIRVINAFRMGIDARYDSSSISSMHSYHSLQNQKLRKPATTASSPLVKSAEEGGASETVF